MQPPGRFTNPNNNLITHSLQVVKSNIYTFTGHSYFIDIFGKAASVGHCEENCWLVILYYYYYFYNPLTT